MDIESLENYIKKTSRSIALFDVPLHFNMHNASCSDGEYDMRNIFNRTLVDSNPKLAVTFVDNHDSQYGQALESWVQEWFKPLAYSLILLRSKGYPCVFFGDYYGVNSQSIKPVKDLDKLLELRKKYAYGIEKDYFDDKNIIGWTRAGDKEHPNSGMAVIMTNNLGGEKKMFMGLDNIGSRYYDYLNNINEEVIIDEEGYGIFKVLDKTVSVWIKN